MEFEGAAKAGATIEIADADRAKLFCGLRKGGSYAFETIRFGGAGLAAAAGGGSDGPARAGTKPGTDCCVAYCEAYG